MQKLYVKKIMLVSRTNPSLLVIKDWGLKPIMFKICLKAYVLSRIFLQACELVEFGLFFCYLLEASHYYTPGHSILLLYTFF